jgi:methyl-accepting chemotaxis protein
MLNEIFKLNKSSSTEAKGRPKLQSVPGFHTVLSALQRVLTQTAVGAATMSVRLGKLASQTTELTQHLHEISGLTSDLKKGIQNVTEVSGRTASDAQKMLELIENGQNQSAQASTAAHGLQQQMSSTHDRITSLISNVQSISEVSKAVQDIATETKILSFNASIEAARAGDSGKGFAVVADHIQKLALTTAQQTQQIFALLDRINLDLEPSRKAVLESNELAQGTSKQIELVKGSMDEIIGLVRDTTANMATIASAVSMQNNSAEVLGSRVDSSTQSCEIVKDQANEIKRNTFGLSRLVEAAYSHFGQYQLESVFHRSLLLAREMSARCGTVFEEAIDDGRFSLDDTLALEYEEIKGASIRRLERLFNVAKVPATGFDPPKFFTKYDEGVDLNLRVVMDEIRAREPRLIFSIVLDLNSYTPIHNTDFCKDYTGNKEADLAGNRAKRFFFDNRVLVRGARVGLGERVIESPEGRDQYLVQTYARDTGAVITVLTLPIFVKGHRYGAVLLGWSSEE